MAERMTHDKEVMGLNVVGFWAFVLLSSYVTYLCSGSLKIFLKLDAKLCSLTGLGTVNKVDKS